ncbi:MAG: response regulator transcription factor [Wenzhouxiangellaceae bacterium]|nr:response regulator transcription factor [Wenzhouxiangellaceae bacterium]
MNTSTATVPVRLVIADDHPLFRGALRQALGALPVPVEIVEADDLETTCRRLAEDPPVDVLLLDLHMPGARGLAGLSRVRSSFPEVAVAVISAHEDPDVIRRAMEFGAAAFIPKRVGLDALTEALEAVLDCRTWLPADLQARVDSVSGEDIELARRIARLTPQQLRVLEMVADGFLNKQIADRLGIQERTVKAHMSEIFARLEVRNRTQAGIAFRRLELVDPAVS